MEEHATTGGEALKFHLDEEQMLLADNVRRLVRDRYSFEQRKAIVRERERGPSSFWRQCAQLGLLGIDIDERYGGSGGDFHDLAVVLEEFGRGLVIDPFVSTVVVGAGLLARAGNGAQKANFLPGVVAGDTKLALAYAEPNSRYDLHNVATTATRRNDGFVIAGRKALVLGADEADVLIVSARTDEGVSLFLVHRDTSGLEVRGYDGIDDRRGAEVLLEAVNVKHDAALGDLGDGLRHLEAAVDRGAAAVCCEAVGAMAVLNDLTLDYLKTRQQFGRPLGKFQALQHRMADMKIAEQLARSAVTLAAAYANSPDAAQRAKAISAAKSQIGAAAQTVGRGAIQLHGGIGLTIEYSAGHYFRRLTAVEMMFGDQAYHLNRYAA
jgi:alkylation response protein AidB-like acyl-CoA dehydrogenase